jgi:hypothetical protein
VSAPLLGFDPGSSLDRFLRGADQFFDRLGDVGWFAMAVALLFYLAHLLARTRAWQNVLVAAYPKSEVSYAKITASYLAGAGLNSFIPARIGDAVKIFLAKKSIRRSSYPAITSSFFVQSVFDTTAGILVFVYAVTQGLLPDPPQLPNLPAFEISFWAENPNLLVFFVTALGILAVTTFAVLARRAELFWEKIKQGVVILNDIPRYLREVALWQGVGWVMRFVSFWFFLEAFHIGGSFQNVMLVMSVQAIATLLPGPIAVLTYSVGQQIAVAVWAALLGFAALALIFRTTDWRSLIRTAGKEADEHREREEAKEKRTESSEAARERERTQPG